MDWPMFSGAVIMIAQLAVDQIRMGFIYHGRMPQ